MVDPQWEEGVMGDDSEITKEIRFRVVSGFRVVFRVVLSEDDSERSE